MASKPKKKSNAKKKRKRSSDSKPRKKKPSRVRKSVKRTSKKKPRPASKRKHPKSKKRATTPRDITIAPHGFQDIAGTTLDEAFATIKGRLENVISFSPRVRVFPYADGSVDGESLIKVLHGVSVNDLLIDIENEFGTVGLKGGYWITVGVRFTIKEDEEIYRRFRGYNDVNTHYQRYEHASIVDVFNIARHQIASGMEDKYGRKPDSVYVRLHWNPTNEQPKGRDTH